eukprot:scaffold186397_cov16-Tisochrysis_lutea.AAC.5
MHCHFFSSHALSLQAACLLASSSEALACLPAGACHMVTCPTLSRVCCLCALRAPVGWRPRAGTRRLRQPRAPCGAPAVYQSCREVWRPMPVSCLIAAAASKKCQ